MHFPARITAFYEVHYLLNGLKKVVAVEKANMSELDAWLCAILHVSDGYLPRSEGLVQDLDAAKAIARAAAITKVRWNKLSNFDRRRPSIFVYGDTEALGIFLKPQAQKEDF